MAAVLSIELAKPFGAIVDVDAAAPLDHDAQAALRSLVGEHKLLVFRGQRLDEADQVRLLGAFGRVLDDAGEYRQISSDGNLGGGPLCFHSDLSFTPEPYRLLSLHALEVLDGETWTRFASGTRAAQRLPPALRTRIESLEATALISAVQSHRAVPYDASAILPRETRPILMAHPNTGEPILYVSEMQTCRIEGLSPDESEALLQELFAVLYAPENVHQHDWRNGDLVIWDNLALQHSRPDLTNVKTRRLQRVTIADKALHELCPQLDFRDPRIAAWGRGEALVLD